MTQDAEPAGCCFADRPAGGDSAETVKQTEGDPEQTPVDLTEPTPAAVPGNQ